MVTALAMQKAAGIIPSVAPPTKGTALRYSFYRYQRRTGFQKISPWDRRRMDELPHYPTPGCNMDPLKRFGKFERWCWRPNEAKELYWRIRPELYQKMKTLAGWK